MTATPGRARNLPRVAASVLRHAFAYCLACVVASAVVIASEIASGWSYWTARNLVGILLLGTMMTFAYALPGTVLVVSLVRWRGWHSLGAYLAAGSTAALCALAFNALIGWGLPTPSLLAEVFAGGVAGGAAYWFVAVRPVLRQGAQARGGVPA